MSTASDRKRLLVFGNGNDGAILGLEEFDLEYLRGLECFFHEVTRGSRPFDDVDLFTAEFGGDDCDAHAALTDKCTHRVDVTVIGEYGDFRT